MLLCIQGKKIPDFWSLERDSECCGPDQTSRRVREHRGEQTSPELSRGLPCEEEEEEHGLMMLPRAIKSTERPLDGSLRAQRMATCSALRR